MKHAYQGYITGASCLIETLNLDRISLNDVYIRTNINFLLL